MEQNGFQFLDRIAYHDYEGIALDADEQERLVADLGDCSVMILRNHGLLACGANISQAFRRIYYLEMACKIQLDAMASGTLSLPARAMQEHTAAQWQTGAAGNGGAERRNAGMAGAHAPDGPEGPGVPDVRGGPGDGNLWTGRPETECALETLSVVCRMGVNPYMVLCS